MKKIFLLIVIFLLISMKAFCQVDFAAKKIIYLNDSLHSNFNVEDTKYLDALCQYLKVNPYFLIKLNAYSDKSASTNETLKRSEDFAKLIASYLENKEINRGRIFINAKGDASSENPAIVDKQKLNRVEIFVIHTNSEDMEKAIKNYQEDK